MLILLYSQLLLSQTDVTDVALKYVGIVEQGQNRGKEIEKWQANVHIPKGSPYCAAFVSWVLDEIGASLPPIRSGLANNFITKNSIRAKDVLKGRVKLDKNYLVIWKRGSTIHGHIGINLVWDRKNGYVIEGNTKFKGKEGVWIRYREIQPYSYFRIVYFTEIQCRKKKSYSRRVALY